MKYANVFSPKRKELEGESTSAVCAPCLVYWDDTKQVLGNDDQRIKDPRGPCTTQNAGGASAGRTGTVNGTSRHVGRKCYRQFLQS